MRWLIRDKDFLFNIAGQTSHMDSMADPFTDLAINATAQLSIVESCRKYNPDIRIVFAGTRQIYGRPEYLPVDEAHPVRPVDINGIHKVAGESYHLLYNSVYNIKSTVLRLTNTYGPRMRIKDARQTFVGIWIRLLLEKQPFEVWGGEQLRDFTYVDDCVEAMLLAASSNNAVGKIYNLGGDCVVSLRELAEMLIKAHGSGEYRLMEYPEDRKKIDIGDYYSKDTLIREELGWEAKTPLYEGLSKTLAYFIPRFEQYL
jgi:nucleoside-diphosphate-sugar epimerase